MTSCKFERGDLVKCTAEQGDTCGIIVKIQQTNRAPSENVDRINTSYQRVYYVLTGTMDLSGPYFSDELVVI